MCCRSTGAIRWCSSAARAAVSTTPNGRGYLDLISGVGVAALGHAHPEARRARSPSRRRRCCTRRTCSSIRCRAELAARLSALSGLPRAFFCNSGTEAIEACLKFARRYWHAQGDAARTEFVAFEHSFHGRTMGALSVTWDDHYRAPFAPLAGRRARSCRPNDPAALRAAVTERHGRDHRRADPGRRRRPADSRSAMADAIREALRAHRRAAHRRRSAVRARPHRPRRSTRRRSACSPT